MNVGNTVWINQTAIGEHMWIILSNATDEGQYLSACVTTLRNKPYEDTSCILGPDDHVEISHPS